MSTMAQTDAAEREGLGRQGACSVSAGALGVGRRWVMRLLLVMLLAGGHGMPGLRREGCDDFALARSLSDGW
jgi:hypothetical protein